VKIAPVPLPFNPTMVGVGFLTILRVGVGVRVGFFCPFDENRS